MFPPKPNPLYDIPRLTLLYTLSSITHTISEGGNTRAHPCLIYLSFIDLDVSFPKFFEHFLSEPMIRS